MTTEKQLQEFMMMHGDVQRPLVQREIEEIHPAATVDKSYPYEVPLPENVVSLGVCTSNDLPVETILRGTYDSKLTDIIVIGTRPDGKLHFATSMADLAVATFMLQRGIHRAMEFIEQQDIEDEEPPTDQPA